MATIDGYTDIIQLSNSHQLRFHVVENSYSIESNTSSVTVTPQFRRTNTPVYGYFWLSYTIVVNGTTYTATASSGSASAHFEKANEWLDITDSKNFPITITVTHESDGTKSLEISATINAYRNSSSFSGNGSVSFALTTIPRASSIAAVDCNIESVTSVMITRASSGFTHTVTWSFGNLSGTLATQTTETTISWTIPPTFYEQIPSAKRGVVTLTCYTYSGTTQVGSSQGTFTVTAAEDKCAPTVTIQAQDINSATLELTGNAARIIKFYSTLRVAATAAAKNSASITSVIINGNDVTVSKTLTIENAETADVRCTVTDSRGYTAEASWSGTLVNYVKLTNNASGYRPEPTTGEINLSMMGNYWPGNFGSSGNELLATYKFRESGASEWASDITAEPAISETTYNEELSAGKIFDYTKAYEFSVTVRDKLSEVTITFAVSRGIPVFDWGETDFRFNVPIKIGETELSETQLQALLALINN